MEASKPYYLYARRSRTAATGSFLLSETPIAMEQHAGWFHLLVGILNSENGGDRSFAQLYGFSEILPGRITTDRIVSNDGRTFFDLLNGIIGGRIMFQSGGSYTDLESWAGSTNNSVRAAQEAADEAREMIEDLEVGGVNLLPDTSFERLESGANTWAHSAGATIRVLRDDLPTQGILRKVLFTAEGRNGEANRVFFQVARMNTNRLHLIGQHTLSGWVKIHSDVPLIGTANVFVRTVDTADPLVINPFIDRGFTFTNLTQDEWHYFSITFDSSTRPYVSQVAMAFINGKVEIAGLQLERGNIASAWSESPLDTQQRIDQAQNTANAANTAVTNAQTSISSLRNFTDTTFRDGVVGRAERTRIEGYLNGIAETKLSIDAGFAQINLSTHLTGTPRTNLATAHTALNTAHTNLVNSINAAIDNDTVTAAQITDVNNRFGLFNTALATYEVRLGEANRAIQTRLDELAGERVDNLQIGGVNLLRNSNTRNFGGHQGSVVTNLGRVAVDKWGATDANRVTASGGTNAIKAFTTVISPAPAPGRILTTSCWFKNNGENPIVIHSNLGWQSTILQPGEEHRVVFAGIIGNGSTQLQFQVRVTNLNHTDVDFTWWRMQVEESNKATAWREHPEDVQARITNAQNTANNANAIADNAQRVANDANNKIDNLQIGGVNLLNDTSFERLESGANTWTRSGAIAFQVLRDNLPQQDLRRKVLLTATGRENETTRVFFLSNLSHLPNRRLYLPGQHVLSGWVKVHSDVSLVGQADISVRAVADATSTHLFSDSNFIFTNIPRDEWHYFKVPFNTGGRPFAFQIHVAFINGKVEVAGLQLERGNIATAWSENPDEIQQRITQAQADATQARAITDGFTQIDGGLVRTNIVLFRETGANPVETAGVSGLQGANRNNPAFWAGGTFAQALARTARAIIFHDGGVVLTRQLSGGLLKQAADE